LLEKQPQIQGLLKPEKLLIVTNAIISQYVKYTCQILLTRKKQLKHLPICRIPLYYKAPLMLHLPPALLQTAQAIATNNCSQLSRPVRILFDNGSQRSYITENLRTQLKLKPICKERLHLNTFGDNKFSSQLREVYKLSLHKPGCTAQFNIVFAHPFQLQ